MNQIERVREGARELVRFGGVGLLATTIHSIVYLLALTVLSPQTANILGYLSAILVSYFGHGQFTFSSRRLSGEKAKVIRICKFTVVSVLGFLLNTAFVFLCVNILNTEPWVAVIFIGGVTPGLTFVALKLWVFSNA